MIFDIIISLICLAVSGFFNGEMDTIKFKPQRAWFQNDWYIKAVNKKNVSWFRNTFLFFTLDGWHLIKCFRVAFFVVPVAIMINDLYGQSVLTFILFEILLIMWQGIFFELSY